MASIITVQTPDPSVLPAEGIQYAKLTQEGKIVAGYIADTRTQAWMVVQADSPAEARQIIDSLPLARFWQFEVTPLLGA